MDAATVGVLTGGIGVAGTLLGVVFTQWRSDVREKNRLAVEERREEQRLAHDAERERDARLFDHRRNAYLAVIEQFHRWSTIAAEVREGTSPEPPEDAMDEFWRVVSEVDLYGSTEAAEKALALYFVLREQVYGPRNPNIEKDDLDLEVMDHQNDFVDAARADLGLTARWPARPTLTFNGERSSSGFGLDLGPLHVATARLAQAAGLKPGRTSARPSRPLGYTGRVRPTFRDRCTPQVHGAPPSRSDGTADRARHRPRAGAPWRGAGRPPR